MTPQQIAKSIADKLRANPSAWRNDGRYGIAETGCHCLAQHIALQVGLDCTQGDFRKVDELGLFAAFEAHITSKIGRPCIIHWNDNATVDQVIELCDKVAAQ